MLYIFMGIFNITLGICLLIFRKRIASVTIKWNHILWGFNTNEKVLHVSYLIFGIFFTVLNLVVLVILALNTYTNGARP